MAKPPRKTLSRCPGCGFEQPEPAHLIATCCQACGSFYNGPAAAANGQRECAVPTVPTAPDLPKCPVFCHRCGTTHAVSPAARNTICPGCASCIDLLNISVLSPTSLPVDTRGSLFVGLDASLSNSWIVCGSARIEGTVRGIVRSEGEVVVATGQACPIQILAPSIVIERNADIRLTGPLETKKLIVRGRFTGSVNCSGTIHVSRTGRLEADICARSLVVEKGGHFRGACQVVSRREEDSGQAPAMRYPFFMLRPSPSY